MFDVSAISISEGTGRTRFNFVRGNFVVISSPYG
jgi:hypothetical protein